MDITNQQAVSTPVETPVETQPAAPEETKAPAGSEPVKEESGKTAEADENLSKPEKRQARKTQMDFEKLQKDSIAKITKMQEKAKKAEEQNSEYQTAFKKMGYESVDHYNAEQSGMSVEEYRAKKENHAKQEALDAKTQALEKQNYDLNMKNKLMGVQMELNTLYPERKYDVLNREMMGDDFYRLLDANISPADAIKMIDAVKTTPPRSSGPTRGAVETKKDFFTKAEVEKMSKEEIRDNMDAIGKSMSKWK